LVPLKINPYTLEYRFMNIFHRMFQRN
jgi:hypothetical protein